MIYYLLIEWDHWRGKEKRYPAQLTRLFTCDHITLLCLLTMTAVTDLGVRERATPVLSLTRLPSQMSRHRPLPSLADLAAVSVREVVRTAVGRLQDFTEGYMELYMSLYFTSRPASIMRRQTIKIIQEYILCVPYLFQVISQQKTNSSNRFKSMFFKCFQIYIWNVLTQCRTQFVGSSWVAWWN